MSLQRKMFYHTETSAIKWFYLISLMLLFCWSSLIECKRQHAHTNDADHELRSLEDDGGGGVVGNMGNGHHQGHRKKRRQHDNKLSLWINEQQLNMLSGNVLLWGNLRRAHQLQYGRDSPKNVFISTKKKPIWFSRLKHFSFHKDSVHMVASMPLKMVMCSICLRSISINFWLYPPKWTMWILRGNRAAENIFTISIVWSRWIIIFWKIPSFRLRRKDAYQRTKKVICYYIFHTLDKIHLFLVNPKWSL